MCVAVPAIIAKVAKKILAILLGDEKGRKTLGYIVGIALFIVLLPVLAVYGLFGWMAGAGATEVVNYDVVYQNIPAEQRTLMEAHEPELNMIETVFRESDLSDGNISKAKTIYLSCLVGKETEENFYPRYVDCFLSQSAESDLFTNISSAFGVIFADEDIQKFNNYYGGS